MAKSGSVAAVRASAGRHGRCRGGRGLSLRVILVLALLALVGVGLLVSGVAATSQLAGFLQGRTDSHLLVASAGAARRPRAGVVPGSVGPAGGGSLPPSRFYISYRTTSGVLISVVPPSAGSVAGPLLPAPTGSELTAGVPYTVTVADGSQWRAVSRLDPTGSVVITLASSLADNHAAVRRMEQVLLIIGGAVLVVLAGLTYLVVHRSLRPLTEVEHTAVAIAAGDLDRRVPEGNPGSEVGRLALALNGMLSQIQSAFQATAASAAQARRAEVASALAEEQATDSEQKMRRFIGDASHELRTPLTIIRGFAERYRQSLGQSAGWTPPRWRG